MQYRLSCQCEKVHHVSTVQAGEEINCECGNTLAVPQLRELKALPPALEEEKTSASDRSRSAWQTWRGPAIALTTGVAVTCALAALWFLFQLSFLDTSYDTEMEISNGNALFDEYSPEELSLVWNNYEEVGIGQKRLPDYEYVRQYALARKYLAGINGTIAAVFLILSFCIWLSARSLARAKTKTT